MIIPFGMDKTYEPMYAYAINPARTSKVFWLLSRHRTI